MASASVTLSETTEIPEFLYHYTSQENLKKILEEGKIKKSEHPKAYVHGPGVYLTALPPEIGRYRIWWNNWGGPSQFSTIFLSPSEANRKTECFIKLRRDRIHVEVILQSTGRDAWIHREDIALDGIDTWYTVGFVDERGRLMALLNQRHGCQQWSHSIQEMTIGWRSSVNILLS